MRRGWLSLGALLAASGGMLPACGDATPVQRGFSSRQILPLRDSTFLFNFVAGNQVYYQTGQPLDQPPATAPPPHYWYLDLGTGQVTDLGMNQPDFAAIAAANRAPATGRYHCVVNVQGDAMSRSLTVTDTQTGVETAIVNATWLSPTCPADDDPTLRFWRVEADGTYSLWMGPYTAPQQVPLPIVVTHLYWPLAGATLVGAPSARAPGGIAAYQIMDAAPSAPVEVIAAQLDSAAWAGSGTTSAQLVSAGLADHNYLLPAGSGHYNYERAMADGSTVMFAGPYPDPGAPRELALFPVAPGDDLTNLRIEPYNYRIDRRWPIAPNWNFLDGASQTVTFRLWRDASRHLSTCPWAGQRVPVARAAPAGDSALFVNPVSCCTLPPSSALLLMVPDAADGNECRTLAPDFVGAADFSPDGSGMFWLVEDPSTKAVLWTAATDGSGARQIGEGKISGAFDDFTREPHFVGDSQLELTLNSDLAWIDVHDDPVQMHYITERAFGGPIDLGRWLVTGHDFSEQDANGKLALVNRDSGETREISPAVTTFATTDVALIGTRPGVFQDDGRMVTIIYIVRGRNPSPQDGLWLATITAQDRQ